MSKRFAVFVNFSFVNHVELFSSRTDTECQVCQEITSPVQALESVSCIRFHNITVALEERLVKK